MEFRNDEHKTPIYPKFKFYDFNKSESYYQIRNINMEMRMGMDGIYNGLKDVIIKDHLCKFKYYEGFKNKLGHPPYITFELKTGSKIREWIVVLQYLYLQNGTWFLISFPFNADNMIIRPKDLFKYDFLDIMRGFIDSSLYEHGLGGEHKPTCFQIPDKYNLYLKLLNKKIIKKYNPEKAFEE